MFLSRRAKAYLTEYPLTVIAYCLMLNHHRFLLRPEEDGMLSRFIQRLFNGCSQAFNKQQNRSSTLLQGRAQSVLVDSVEYVLRLCRYTQLDPVQADLVSRPGDWPYGNFPEWVERRNRTLVDRGFVRQYSPTGAEHEAFVLSEVNPSLTEKPHSYYLD
jgi:putative transposase